MEKSFIKIDNVSKYYKSTGTVALGLRHINLELNKGEIIGIVGESGSGKSTLLNIISGMDTYEDGQIYYDGQETAYFDQEDIENFRKNHVGFIFQNYNLIESYTVLQNVMTPLLLKGVDEKKAMEKAKVLIEKVGLKNRYKNKAVALSGGEKQRCVIARALASDSEILACDEPTGNLDSKTAKEIIKLIEEVSEDRLVLIVSHNFSEIDDIVTRKIRLHDGEIVEDRKLKNAIISYKKSKEECKKLKSSQLYRFSKMNTRATPHLSIFSLLIFLVIGFVVATMFSNLINSNKETQGEDLLYANAVPGRTIIAKDDNSPIDITDLDNKLGKDNYYNFAFMEEQTLTWKTVFGDLNTLLSYQMPTSLRKATKDVTKEKPILKEGKALLGYSKNDKYSLEKFVGRKIKMSNWTSLEVEIVGLYEGKIDKNLIVLHPKDAQKITTDFLKKNASFSLLGSSTKNTVEGYYNAAQILIDDSLSDDKIIINSPTTMGIDNTKIPKLNSYIYLNIKGRNVARISHTKFNYEVSNYTGGNLEAKMSKKYLYKLYQENQFVVSSYLGYDEVNKKLNSKDSSGYQVINPNKTSSNIGMNQTIQYIDKVMLVISTLVGLAVVYFFSYLILSRIYGVKKKDFTMIRTLGMSKKQMSKVVKFDLLRLSLFSSSLILILIGVLDITTKIEVFQIFSIFKIYHYIMYFIVMWLFGTLIASKFNRQLFKYSVATTFKQGEIDND